MIKILQLPLGPLQTNCYLLGCEETMQAAIIDPAWNGRAIAATADEQGWEITQILLTHSHFDHIGGLADLKSATHAPIYIHPEAIPMMQTATMQAALYQMHIPAPPPPDEMLHEGQTLTVGNCSLRVLYTPGHAPGHVSFYLPEHGVVFSGDALFQNSIGRTDLPGGDYHTLIRAIQRELLSLPDETHVLSGHGPATTIGEERRNNPFLQ